MDINLLYQMESKAKLNLEKQLLLEAEHHAKSSEVKIHSEALQAQEWKFQKELLESQV